MIELTEEQWVRIVAMLPKLRLKKAKRDKVKGKELSKLSKAELIGIIQEMLS